MKSAYRYFLSLSSQFPFCGIPFRLDSYSACQFGCRYCFAAARGGASGSAQIRAANPKSLKQRFDRIYSRGPQSALDEMLQKRIPVHFGGMSDPFMPAEEKQCVTLDLLAVLAEQHYPTVISTKGTLAATDKYLDILTRGRFAVQFSFSSLSDQIARAREPATPLPSERLDALKKLARAGIATSIRLQPFFPTQDDDGHELVEAAAISGARHFSLEHLKLPVERNLARRLRLNAASGKDLYAHYAAHGATREGREWILPVSARLDAVNGIGGWAHAHGMSFGAADNDLLHWSDGNVCCSGADLLGIGDGMQFNFLTAVRRGMHSGKITFNSIADEWRPHGAIGQYVNSSSRSKGGATVEAYVQARWNGVNNGPSPLTFYGVEFTPEFDAYGYRIYSFSRQALPFAEGTTQRARSLRRASKIQQRVKFDSSSGLGLCGVP